MLPTVFLSAFDACCPSASPITFHPEVGCFLILILLSVYPIDVNQYDMGLDR